MLERLKEIDTSAITELQALREQRRVLSDRLDAMETRKDTVSPSVFSRVHTDYEARAADLDERARPWKEKAAVEYAKLGALLGELAADLDEARFAQEEVEFRHSLGEYEQDEFERRLDEARQHLDRREADLAEANELQARFIEAFASEEELLAAVEAHAAGAADDGAPAGAGGPPEDGRNEAEEVVAAPADRPAEEQPLAEEATGAESTAGAEAATGAERPEGSPRDDGTGEGGGPAEGQSRITAQLSVARLELRGEDGRVGEFPLQLGTTTIGRSPRNDICIREASVSRHHAKIVFAQRGFVLYDLGSENGVFVNGERAKERLLLEGDEVEFGPGLKPYVFCGP